MVSNPGQWVTDFESAGADQFTFHLEAFGNDCDRAIELAQTIRKHGMDAGLSIKPGSTLDAAKAALDSGNLNFPVLLCCYSSCVPLNFYFFLGLFKTLLVMTVEPGFGGQAFMETMMPKVEEARRRYPHLIIQVDGGINAVTAKVKAHVLHNASVFTTLFNKTRATEYYTNRLYALCFAQIARKAGANAFVAGRVIAVFMFCVPLL